MLEQFIQGRSFLLGNWAFPVNPSVRNDPRGLWARNLEKGSHTLIGRSASNALTLDYEASSYAITIKVTRSLGLPRTAELWRKTVRKS